MRGTKGKSLPITLFAFSISIERASLSEGVQLVWPGQNIKNFAFIMCGGRGAFEKHIYRLIEDEITTKLLR